MQNDFDDITDADELTEEAHELIGRYRSQRSRLAELVSAFGNGHQSVLNYAKVVALTARELLDEHGVDADAVADVLDTQAKAKDILDHLGLRNRALYAFGLMSAQMTTTVYRTGALADSFYEVIGRMPIAISAERREALRKLTNLKAITLDVRPADVHATTHTYQQVILTDLGKALMAELEK